MMHVYVVESEHGPVKIGVSRSPEQRAKDLCREGFGVCSLHYATAPLSHARNIEICSHHILSDSRIDGEWFDIPASTAVDTIAKAIQLVESGTPYRFLDNTRNCADRQRRKEAKMVDTTLTTKSVPLSNLEKQKRKIERDLANGIVRRMVSIPIERDAELKKIVAEWRAQKQHDTGEKL